LIVTNAHVVAGVTEPQVRTFDGRHLRARVVLFDEPRDLAVLVPLDGPTGLQPLPQGTAAEGDLGVVYGYPSGDLRMQPYEVFRVQTVQIPEFHGEGHNDREVYFLSSRLAQGDSGAPLVSPTGEVVGVAFATSDSAPDRAF